ncbi:MAG: hypothetical protein K6G90_09090, partial [Clostridia bacterium]|nr:hypothetical protein [Clostridia bacterium]
MSEQRSNAGTYFAPLHQVGEQVTVWNEIPFSPDGLADGSYWYNVNEFSLQDDYPVQQVYLSADHNSIKVVMDYEGSPMTVQYSRGDQNSESYFAPLHQVGETDPYSGWIDLQFNADGVNPGDYYFDLEAFTNIITNYMGESYIENTYGEILHIYLKQDHSVITLIGTEISSEEKQEDDGLLFMCLKQVPGDPLDPFAGYNDLPFSPVGLENGAYWFNTEDYDIGFELVRAALSDDLNSIILQYDVNGTEQIQRYTRGDDGADIVFRALHQVGEADPYARPEIPEGYELIWYDKADVDDFGFYIDIPGAVAALYPGTPEDEVYLTAETMIETGIQYYIDPLAYEEG